MGLQAKLCKKGSGEADGQHWLHPAASKFGQHFVADVRAVLGAAALFLLYPPFWALFDQQATIL
jgi:hypothetical protein